MSDSTNPWQTIIIPVFTTALTLAGTSWLASEQNIRSDRTRFIDGAQATAQEASRILDDGYQALSKLVAASGEDGWQKFSASAWREYIDFHVRWRRQAITLHFQLTRYYGKDLADQLVHIDEIDLTPVDNLSSPNPCTPAGGKDSFDVVKLAAQTECTTRSVAFLQDAATKALARKSDKEFFDAMAAVRSELKFSAKLLKQYDQTSVSYLRALSGRLTSLGSPEVKVLAVGDAQRK